MSLEDGINSLATRAAQEIKSVRGELTPLVDRSRVSSFGPMRMSAGPRRMGLDEDYSASPNVGVLGDGRIAMIWRQGGGHATRDGQIMLNFSSDEGRTWTTPEIWMAYPGGGIDPRGTAITAGTDGQTVYVPYFYGSDANPAMGVYIKISPDNCATWGPEIAVTPHADYAGTDCSGVIDVDGTLMLPWYGKVNDAVEPRDSAFLAKSTDGGLTWTHQLIADATADGRHYHEPQIADCDGVLVMSFRWDTTASIGMSRSYDRGVTWEAPTLEIATGSGKATLIWSSTKVLTCIYRHPVSGAAIHRSSFDLGYTWTKEVTFARHSGDGVWTVYAGACEISPGMMLVAQGVEEGNSQDCRIHLFYLTDGTANTPIGLQNYDHITRTLLRVDQIVAADDFDRLPTADGLGNSLTGQPWFPNNWGKINGVGEATPNLTGAHYPTLNCGSTNVTIEADMYLGGGNAYVDFGIIMRYQNSGNHFLYRVAGALDTPNPTVGVSFYVRNAGIYYFLANAGSVTVSIDTYNRWACSIRGNRFIGFVNEQAAIAYTIGVVDMDLLFGMPHHGLKMNAENGYVQACRRFVVYS